MRLSKNLGALLLAMGLLFANVAFAVEPLPTNLMAFHSDQGTELLKRSATVNTAYLLENFTTQDTQTYCGVASAVMVLNSLIVANAPIDPAYDPNKYFTQKNFFTKNVLNILKPENVLAKGMTLADMTQALSTFDGVSAQYFNVTDKLSLPEFITITTTALSKGQYVTVNFLRTQLGFKTGGGHHSPVAAYDEKTRQFLILDVARYKYPAFWVSADDLWKAMNTLDDDAKANRGFIVIDKRR